MPRPLSRLHNIKPEAISIAMNGVLVFALGMAIKTRNPVALLCTSGTAPLNGYAPAIAEACYQKIPLLVNTPTGQKSGSIRATARPSGRKIHSQTTST
ncbi:MAG: hypothetical protein IPH20_19185 [Bacteroidales bacterium]|nr:hypothetical protein [Bacteroidales bacterium]